VLFLHDALLVLLLAGGVVVEVSLVRFLVCLTRAKEEESLLLAHPDQTPSEIIEAIHVRARDR